MECSRELAQKEGIFVGITGRRNVRRRARGLQGRCTGSTVLCMLPDTGERYLITPLFADIGVDMNEDELKISNSTPESPDGTRKRPEVAGSSIYCVSARPDRHFSSAPHFKSGEVRERHCLDHRRFDCRLVRYADSRRTRGLLYNLAVGLVGAIVGGFLFEKLRLEVVPDFWNLITATIGAVVFLLIWRAIRRA